MPPLKHYQSRRAQFLAAIQNPVMLMAGGWRSRSATKNGVHAMNSRKRKLAPVLFLVASAGCAFVPGNLGLQSIEADRRMGAETAEQVKSQIGLYQDREKESYLRRLGERLVGELDDDRFDFRFHIVDQLEPNAFAAPGGWMIVRAVL